jgi:hypothetical protein
MSFRLGQYECGSCGHIESTLAEPIAKMSTRASLGGSDSKLGKVPHAVTGTVYGTSDSSQSMQETVLNPSLELEKKLLMLFYIFLMLMNGTWASHSDLRFYFEVAGVVIFYIVAALIGLAVLFIVLKSDQAWLKYGCMGCSGLSAVSQFISLFVPAGMAGSGKFSDEVILMSGMLSVIYSAWLASILYRDLTQR